jgi:adenosylhomocysteinase
MSLSTLFEEPWYRTQRRELPLVALLIERFAAEKPFAGARVAFGHLLVRNSIPLVEALWRGGAEVLVSDVLQSSASAFVKAELARHEVRLWPAEEAAAAGELHLDVNALLGRLRTPRAASEITRTGLLHYERLGCPVISADDSMAKRIEAYFGTGDGFVRAYRQFRPEDALPGRRLVQFGYGKIGRGLAARGREEGMEIFVIDCDPAAVARARAEGFAAVVLADGAAVERALRDAQIVVTVTGVPGALGRSVEPAWLRASRPVLVSLGAEDEFGPEIRDDEVLKGKGPPFNHHIDEPTRNRYMDPSFAAHLLGLAVLAAHPERFPVGIHPLPSEDDAWIMGRFRARWPDVDTSRI